MTFGLLIGVNGNDIDFEDRAPLTAEHRYRFRVVGDDGLGLADLHRLNERGPLQHGESDYGFRLDPRVFSLTILVECLNVEAYWEARRVLLSLFKPSRNNIIKLKYTLDGGLERTIEAHTINGLSLSLKDRSFDKHRDTVQLRAPDPTFYDPNAKTVTYGVGGGSGAFTIPMAIPLGVGSSTVNQTKAVVYGGDWLEYPVITVKGPISNPVITHVETGDVLDFTGTTLLAADTYTIDLRYGKKTVVDQNGVNKLPVLTDASDIATFALYPDPDAPGGVNTIKVTGSAATLATEIYLTYYDRFVGI